MRRGWSFREELSIFLLAFARPALLGVFVKWKFWSLYRAEQIRPDSALCAMLSGY